MNPPTRGSELGAWGRAVCQARHHGQSVRRDACRLPHSGLYPREAGRHSAPVADEETEAQCVGAGLLCAGLGRAPRSGHSPAASSSTDKPGPRPGRDTGAGILLRVPDAAGAPWAARGVCHHPSAQTGHRGSGRGCDPSTATQPEVALDRTVPWCFLRGCPLAVQPRPVSGQLGSEGLAQLSAGLPDPADRVPP